MRFHTDGPCIPDVLLERCDAGRVVFLCGAGVSLPSGMPTFVDLTRYVIEFFDPPADSEIMTAFRPWLGGQSAANVPLDQIFNLLHLEYGKDEVNALVTDRLSAPMEGKNLGREHILIKRISSSESGVPQIVTTNFDRLFEIGQEGEHLVQHVPPAFPDLRYGSKIEGVTYLHGRLVNAACKSHFYVLSSADFGRAYLAEGWATNFIRHLLDRYTVVLVGYQAEDPPIKYLLQGLNHDGLYDRSRLYAFDRGLPEEIEAKWRDRGATAIAYSDHPDLWKSMEAWADRSDDPGAWRLSIIAKSKQDPKDLASHERGQVAHVLRTVKGAKLFSEADPTPHPEWVCVMDADVRSAEPSRSNGENAEVFDPRIVYGLDDDLENISEDDRKQGVSNGGLLVWLDEDDNPNDSHRLHKRQTEGFETIPKRLGYLTTWIEKSIDSPVLAWWAIRQNGLHPRLVQSIEWRLRRGGVLHERARHAWRLILEYHRDRLSRRWDGGWYDLTKRVVAEGWSSSVLREFRRVAMPRINIKPLFGLGQSKPPSSTWEYIHLRDLGQFELNFLERHGQYLEVTDDILPDVVGILEETLIIASGLFAETEQVYIQTPTCYPNRRIEGRQPMTGGLEVVTWFVQLFDRMAALWPEVAKAHSTSWPAKDRFFFRKLKLYAFSKADLFEADYVANAVLSLSQESFWDIDVVRELLFLLVDRWDNFSQDRQDQLSDRILSGPPQRSHWSDQDFPGIRDKYAARYARYLELQTCALSADRSERLAEIIKGIPGWSDGWATSTVSKHGPQVHWVGTDETAGELMELPVNEVIPKAKENLNREFGNFIDKRPFTGLVKASPRKALSALTIAGRTGDYPHALWATMVDEIPKDIMPRLKRLFLHRIARLPYALIAGLSHTFGQWLERNLVALLEFDDELGWAVYDHIVAGIIGVGADATKSGLGEVRQGGTVIQRSRRTYDHAINGPVGMCAAALFHAVTGAEQAAGSLIPDHIKSRAERLLGAPGEGSDHAVSIATNQLNWLNFVDRAWTERCLVPMLAFEHPASEPAWAGFLHKREAPRSPLAEIIKPLMLDLFHWVEELSLDRELLSVAAQWMGLMRMFRPNEPGGLSRAEMRSVLRAMSDDIRNRFIFWLGRVGQKNENGWVKYVIPLINEDWPRERRYRTSTSMRAWISLLDETGDHFPAVYEAIKKFLVPVESNDLPFYRFTGEVSEEKPITTLFPESTLDFMDRATPQVLTGPPYELSKVLALIAQADPALTSDSRYLRLMDLVERS